MTPQTHEPPTAPLLSEGAVLWTVAYVALTTLTILAGGSVAMYLVTTVVPGLAPAGVLLLVMIGVVAVSPTLARTTLQTLYNRRHPGHQPDGFTTEDQTPA